MRPKPSSHARSLPGLGPSQASITDSTRSCCLPPLVGQVRPPYRNLADHDTLHSRHRHRRWLRWFYEVDVRMRELHLPAAHHNGWGDHPSLAIRSSRDFECGPQDNLLHPKPRRRTQRRHLADYSDVPQLAIPPLCWGGVCSRVTTASPDYTVLLSSDIDHICHNNLAGGRIG